MSVEKFFAGKIYFAELKPEEKLEVLYKFLEEIYPEKPRKEIYDLFPKLSRHSVDRVLRLLFFSDLIYLPRGKVVVSDFGKKILEKGRLLLEDLKKAPEWVIRVLTRKPMKIQFYRVSLVWMFYAKKPRRYTPDPFAEFRAFVVTRTPKKYPESVLKKVLLNLVKLFSSVERSWKNKLIYIGDARMNPLAESPEEAERVNFEIFGYEVEKIDRDEVEATLNTTGLPRPKIDRIYRYV
ncbi:MAG: hypothetical protein J7L54_05495, partial [Elusimicrobia bacterium]|nr:hypothetical protein [Elusimicrobiota bacterium]